MAGGIWHLFSQSSLKGVHFKGVHVKEGQRGPFQKGPFQDIRCILSGLFCSFLFLFRNEYMYNYVGKWNNIFQKNTYFENGIPFVVVASEPVHGIVWT